ncbi:glutathione S-transferase [Pectobacterium brasiliense]|uniref:glutathione S-transferase family protein n=1 Tax=Pectobacterium TaxID=122277 RepID=UPI0015DE41E4|nr:MULTISPECIES: glutathione S-transferase [Pectobacterium]MBA0215363.1 glutathione S-transferase [Pectobacterium brasiliense]MBB1528506.1 glutathione S-transferase [Pectobacterium carotovorum subsp. carotovorum]MBN3055113.1 glutathione S-transferase [Pectobacterium brasiliense]MBN3253282.1 glutathione S-transferase [Pectobacterium brasiliense]UPY93562.1 glutathione S-transferase [Pectobacterium sp. 21LCBS03]
MITIWGRDNSTNVKKVLWCAEELALPYQHIVAGGQFGLNHEADYLAMNPNGLIPCLRDDDLVLWESNTIVRYLAAQYGQDSLYLADPGKRASAEKWMDWATSLAFSFGPVFVNIVRTPPEKRDTALVQKGIAECERLFDIVDTVLANQPWLSGAQFGVGDIPLGCIAYGWLNMPIEQQSHPHLERWYQQLTERPAYQKHVMIPLS